MRKKRNVQTRSHAGKSQTTGGIKIENEISERKSNERQGENGKQLFYNFITLIVLKRNEKKDKNIVKQIPANNFKKNNKRM